MSGRARGYSWEPFTPGHTKSLRHGAYSERKVGPLAEELEAELPAVAPWTARPAFAGARRTRCRTAAIAELLWRDIAEHGVLDAEGNVRPSVDAYLRWSTAAANRDTALGLDPAGLAKLLAAFTQSGGADDVLARLQAEGAAILAARSQEALPAAETGVQPPHSGNGVPDDDRLDSPADRAGEWT